MVVSTKAFIELDVCDANDATPVSSFGLWFQKGKDTNHDYVRTTIRRGQRTVLIILKNS